MTKTQADVLYTPPTEEQRFLPEGPYPCPDGRLSWVSIQHGVGSTAGSLNILDLKSGKNENFPLPGRPGFAFATDQAGVFVAGVERSVVLFNINDGAITELVTGIDANVSGTIINDAMVYDGHLILGCKDPQFAEKKAGLYLIRRRERQAAQLADDQVCSNGKAIVKNQDGSHTLYDICSHSKQVVSWRIDFNTTCLTDRRVFVDLTDEPVFPDGMILTPDQGSLIVAIYDPRAESIDGEARQYSIVNGRLQATWICPRSPRVTCPQLVSRGGQIELVLTTAVEGMPAKQRETCSHAGCLFVATTPFTSVSDAPVFPIN